MQRKELQNFSILAATLCGRGIYWRQYNRIFHKTGHISNKVCQLLAHKNKHTTLKNKNLSLQLVAHKK